MFPALEEPSALTIFFVVILCLLLAIGLYAGLMASGILPGHEREERPTGRYGYSGDTGIFPRVPHLRELPQGCLIALILVATLWFAAWGVLLIIALNFLRDTT